LVLIERELVVGVVAMETIQIPIGIADLPGTVHTLFQIIKDIIMTGKAMIHMKKFSRFLVHIPGFGMKTLFNNISVTVLTRRLSMG
jgi:hypothetical protein